MDEEKILNYARQINENEEKMQKQDELLSQRQQRIILLEEQIKVMGMIPALSEEEMNEDISVVEDGEVGLEKVVPKLHRQVLVMQKQMMAMDAQFQSLMAVVQRIGVPTDLKHGTPPLPPTSGSDDMRPSEGSEAEVRRTSSQQQKEEDQEMDVSNTVPDQGFSSARSKDMSARERPASQLSGLSGMQSARSSTAQQSGRVSSRQSTGRLSGVQSARPSINNNTVATSNSIQMQLLEEWGEEKRKEVHDQYREELADLHKQLEVLERKLQNSRFVAEAHQTVATEAKAAQWKAEADAKEWRRQLQRIKENDVHRQRTVQLEKLQRNCKETFQQLTRTEGEIREAMADPMLSLPIGTQRRKDLARFERKLKKLKEKDVSQTKLLKELEYIQTLQDDLFAGSSNGNMDQVLRAVQARRQKQSSDDPLEVNRSNPNAPPTCIVTDLDVSANVPDGSGFSALEYASGNGHTEVVHFLVKEAGADVLNGKPLLLAAKNGHSEIVEFLLENDADPQIVDESGKTALHLACLEGYTSTAEVLINAGVDVQPIDNAGNTPLHFLAKSQFTDTARFLLENGAALDLKNSQAVGALSPADIAHYDNNRQMLLVFRDYAQPAP